MEQFDYDIDDFMDYCKCQNLRPKTMHAYEQSIRLFANYCISAFNITEAAQVKEIHIREYVKYLSERGKYTVTADEQSKQYNHPDSRKDTKKPMSAATINNYLRNIKVFFNYLYDNHYISKNPVVRIKQLHNEHKPVDFLSDAEFKKLMNCFKPDAFSEQRDKTIVMLLIDTGMRIGECLLIKISDVDMTRCSIYLPAENTKGRHNRVVFFSKEMQKQLRRWLQYQDRYRNTEFLFCTNQGNKLTVSNFEANLRKYGKRSGIKNIHPHMFRNNFAKRFLMNGGNIFTLSKILGHSSVTVTEKAYLDLTEDDLQKSYTPFSPIANMRHSED